MVYSMFAESPFLEVYSEDQISSLSTEQATVCPIRNISCMDTVNRLEIEENMKTL